MSRTYRKNLIWKYQDKELKRYGKHKLRQRMKRMDDCWSRTGSYRKIQYEDYYCDFTSYLGWNSEREWKDIHRPYYETEAELHSAFMRTWKCR